MVSSQPTSFYKPTLEAALTFIWDRHPSQFFQNSSFSFPSSASILSHIFYTPRQRLSSPLLTG